MSTLNNGNFLRVSSAVLSNFMDVIGSWFGNFRPKTHLKSILSISNFHVGFGHGVLKPNETLLIMTALHSQLNTLIQSILYTLYNSYHDRGISGPWVLTRRIMSWSQILSSAIIPGLIVDSTSYEDKILYQRKLANPCKWDFCTGFPRQ